ncbi:hypothetical protein A7X67_16170 [Clostridium sp. W14A]|nr:hypothetical protein A7X67_16170 [Clostridium sp. W14A]
MKEHFYYQGLLGEHNPLLRFPALFEAALSEFARKDFEEASLNDILKQADMSKGSLYHHFGDKFGLYLSTMELIVKKKTEFFSDAIKKAPNDFNFFDTLKQLVRATVDFLHTDERFYQVLNQNLNASEELREQLIAFFPHDPGYGFDKLVLAGLRSGQIDGRYSPEFISGVFEILFEHLDRLLPENNPSRELVAAIDRLIELLRQGISAKERENE